MLSRQQFLRLLFGASVAGFAFPKRSLTALANADLAQTAAKQNTQGNGTSTGKLDRRQIVARHNVTRTATDPNSPLQVGNGNFAFGADITGLQTFTRFNTMSTWGWHELPLLPGQKPGDFHGIVYKTHGRDVSYESPNNDQVALGQWLYKNPHRINLGRIGLILTKSDGSVAGEADISGATQTLDLWTGVLTSSFTLENQPVEVQTCTLFEPDGIAVKVDSPLLSTGKAKLYIDFPYDDTNEFAMNVGDWSDELRHTTAVVKRSATRADIVHKLDTTSYNAAVAWSGDVQLTDPAAALNRSAITILSAKYGADPNWADVTSVVSAEAKNNYVNLVVQNETLGGDPYPQHPKTLAISYKVGDTTYNKVISEQQTLQIGDDPNSHRYILSATGDTLEAVFAFAPAALPDKLMSSSQSFVDSAQKWEDYWQSGGAIDLSESTDPRWQELERRIVLSQYLMKVNEASTLPPQESGLVNNGWNGKFHMEMYWWHSAHWALWNRWQELDPSTGVYEKFLASSKKRAKSQGYLGARWPKMVGPEGLNSPHIIHGLLIWQQPHPIFFAELEYRARPTQKTLDKWKDVVNETADFMSSYAFWDDAGKRFVLGPPMFVVSENTDPFVTMNPTFELSYWRFGLRVAQTWRERLGEKRNAAWDNVLNNLSALPQQDGSYVLYEGVPDMWTKYNYEHPALTGVYGWLPGDGVDQAVMRQTIEMVKAHWNMGHVWGWDMPVLAMNAARMSDPARAVDMLLLGNGNFNFDDAGLASGGPYPYFPSNGGLLYTIALMAAGWDGAPDVDAPGFPQDGTWTVKHEGLSRAI